MNPLERIKFNTDKFTKSEKEIAQYILKVPTMVVKMSLIELSKEINTSKTALIRFSQKIDYNGFSEFKFDLSRFLISNNHNTEENNLNSITSITHSYCEYIEKINSFISIKDIRSICSFLINAPRVKIFGFNRTGFSANQLRYRLSKIGFDAEAVTDSVLMNDCASNSRKDDLCIIFSITGSKQIYLNVAKVLKENKCNLVVISMEPANPLKSFADRLIILPYISKLSDIKFLDDQAIFFIFIEILLAELASLSKKSD